MRSFNVDIRTLEWEEFESLYKTLLQSEFECSTTRRYFLRTTEDEKTLRALNNAYSEEDNWRNREPYDSSFFKKLRRLNKPRTSQSHEDALHDKLSAMFGI